MAHAAANMGRMSNRFADAWRLSVDAEQRPSGERIGAENCDFVSERFLVCPHAHAWRFNGTATVKERIDAKVPLTSNKPPG